ncbi:complex I subunit 5 family protein [Natronospira sp.]|uniref:complex I subunit 5 family protein n=1 Tax=Natronospira sp. TaxID=2024970 RepID=UPI003872F27C
MMSSWLPPLLAFCLPVLPLLVAAGLFLASTRSLALRTAPWLPLLALPLVLLHDQLVELPWLLLGARVGVDNTALPLLLLAIAAWTVAGLHASDTIEREQQPRFYLFWLLTWTGNLCVFITLDAASFYAAYAMMSVSAYGLVIFFGRMADYRAGRVYLVMALLGEAMILSGLILLAGQLGNAPLDALAAEYAGLNHGTLISWLFLAGFAVKMGLIPLHMWLPLAHPQAPVPASAVLSGVILKAGLIGWLRFLPLGSEGIDLETAGLMLLAAGLFTGLVAALIGMSQHKAKVILAYSSISQMGLVASLVGMALYSPENAPLLISIAVLFALHHGLSKTLLFLGVDHAGHRWIGKLLWLPSLSLAGAPLLSGALAKILMKSEIPESLTWLEPILLISSLLTTLLLMRFLHQLAGQHQTADNQWSRPVVAWMILLLLSLGLPWIIAITDNAMESGIAVKPGYLLETGLPVLLGLFLAALTWRYWPANRHPRIPAGDLIELFRLPTLRQPSWSLPGRPAMPTLLPVTLRQLDARLAAMGPALLVWLVFLALLGLLAI